MYPDWPESDADLVPLPLCDGPKLKAFDFQGPQSIRFIDYIGSGLHSHVVKIQIKDQLYALKLFTFLYDYEWNSPKGHYSVYDRELFTAFYNYYDPFTCECRAYGRLQETGNEDLAVQAFGYILLDEEHERKLENHFNHVDFHFEGLLDEDDGPKDCRSRYLGKSGKPPPVRGIVKALGRVQEEKTMRAPFLRKILSTIPKLQKLGIFSLDLKSDQFIDGKLGDFSVAVTVPHCLTNPELNPYLTPEMISILESYTFRESLDDYRGFDWMVFDWNTQYAKEKGKLSVSAFPDFKGCQNRYNLRSKAAEGRVFTFVDPRKFYRASGIPLSFEDYLTIP
ncbi:hypothetical protein UCRPA7_3792 [Phaeoacremonium minimum UCRPA7]|uniref:Uncharacterized protein n=1 Tax=Phaeoacremonium minimum (strain UCR-PA7) TaxID=1286976 RepID=R8BN89_PHAM7|nr:hypothetical protein UCRPA7_3792 [Phaeoacremonium minimum UCRPA7]EOO00802.1 hypothetical protein UCRPA7_3792 [Phaeoacremonium minimum UCRPA7]